MTSKWAYLRWFLLAVFLQYIAAEILKKALVYLFAVSKDAAFTITFIVFACLWATFGVLAVAGLESELEENLPDEDEFEKFLNDNVIK